MNYLDWKSTQLGYLDYSDYLNSFHWEQIKLKYRDRKCFCCLVETQLQLHHISYENLGKENASDLVTLCKKCHQSTHKLITNGRKLHSAHLIHRDNLAGKVIKKKKNPSKKKQSKKKRVDKWVNWRCLSNPSRKETTTELQAYMEKYDLLSGRNATKRAFNLGLVKVVESKEKWHLGNFIRYRKRNKKTQPFPVREN